MTPTDEGLAVDLQGVRMVYPVQRGLLEVLRRPFAKPPGVEALKDIDMQARRGEIFGLLGPNGAGKTTLTRILCNLIDPTSGSVRVCGHDLRRAPVALRRSVGLVSSDERSFFWRLSALENLMFFSALHRVPSAEARARIGHYVEFFGLESAQTRRFGLCSSGQKKLFAIIRALVPRHPVLVFDEATNALDPTTAARLLEYVRDDLAGKEGRTIVWATHRLEEAQEICDSVMLIYRGRSRFAGSFSGFAALGDHPRPGHRALMQVFKRLVES
jgi:ABC-2 type transport system ATP-binding protein